MSEVAVDKCNSFACGGKGERKVCGKEALTLTCGGTCDEENLLMMLLNVILNLIFNHTERFLKLVSQLVVCNKEVVRNFGASLFFADLGYGTETADAQFLFDIGFTEDGSVCNKYK